MKTIEEKAKNFVDHCQAVVTSEGNLYSEAAVYSAYLAGATENLAGQWRSVGCELPDSKSFCITMVNEDSRPCLCHYDGDVFIEDYSGMACAVKYWMPIHPPKHRISCR